MRIGIFADTHGANKVGILSGIGLVSQLFAHPPVAYQAADGTRFLIAQIKRQILVALQPFDIAVYAHMLKPRPSYDRLPERRFEYVPLWAIPVCFVYALRRVDRDCRSVSVERVPWRIG